jgi:broad specificity phosphatase PhoE
MAIFHILTPGENSWTKKQLHVGVRDISLSKKGRKQALLASKLLINVPIIDIYTSRNTHARQYAIIIQEELCKKQISLARQSRVKEGKTKDNRLAYLSIQKRNAFSTIKIKREKRLDDINKGDWQGKFDEEVEGRFSKTWETWLNDPDKVSFEKGESVESKKEQWFDFLSSFKSEQLFEDHHAVITHPLQYSLLITHLYKIPLKEVLHQQFLDAKYIIVEYNSQNGYKVLQSPHYIDPFL